MYVRCQSIITQCSFLSYHLQFKVGQAIFVCFDSWCMIDQIEKNNPLHPFLSSAFQSWTYWTTCSHSTYEYEEFQVMGSMLSSICGDFYYFAKKLTNFLKNIIFSILCVPTSMYFYSILPIFWPGLGKNTNKNKTLIFRYVHLPIYLYQNGRYNYFLNSVKHLRLCSKICIEIRTLYVRRFAVSGCEPRSSGLEASSMTTHQDVRHSQGADYLIKYHSGMSICPVNWVARWYIFKPKILIWVNLGWSCNRRCWNIFWPFGRFYGLWYILWPFGIVF
jgi:hypothetical protein